MAHFDRYELRMLALLQEDGRRPVSELAEELGLSATPCARRLEGLRAAGVITGFRAEIARQAVGLDIEVFIQVTLVSHSDGSPDHFRQEIMAIPEVTGCWALTGDQDFLLHVMVPDVAALTRFVMHRLMRIRGVRDVKTNLVLENIKPHGTVPLTHLTPA